MSEYLSPYLEERFNDLQKISDEYIRNSNNEYGDLTKHISILASIFLPLVGVFISSDAYIAVATTWSDISAFILAISLCIALSLGLIGYLIGGEYWLKQVSKIELAQNKINNIKTTSTIQQSKIVSKIYAECFDESETGSVLVWLSVCSIAIALVNFIFLLYIIIF